MIAGTSVVPADPGQYSGCISTNVVCPYCHKKHPQTPSSKFTPPLCTNAPFTHWRSFSLINRDRHTTVAVRDAWTFRCISCGHKWASMKALAAHRTGCEHRRAPVASQPHRCIETNAARSVAIVAAPLVQLWPRLWPAFARRPLLRLRPRLPLRKHWRCCRRQPPRAADQWTT